MENRSLTNFPIFYGLFAFDFVLKSVFNFWIGEENKKEKGESEGRNSNRDKRVSDKAIPYLLIQFLVSHEQQNEWYDW